MTTVSIVGAGVMGCAAAWALGARGADVRLYEQFDLGHDRGSSHGPTRIVRLAYPDPAWVPLAREALAGWRELERDSGRTLLGLHGLVELAASLELTSAAGLAEAGIEHSLLDADEAAAHGVELPPGWTAVWQPEAGVVHAGEAQRALLDLARAPVEHTRIESLDDVGGDVVVVAAGPWIRGLVPDLQVRVTRETVAYFGRAGPPIPSVVELDAASKHAFYALHDPVHGLKAGVHQSGHETDPDVAEGANPRLVERIAAWVRARLGVEPSPVAGETCLYTSTADESFVLERRGRIVVCSACSGHGFKFAPAIGRRIADLALQ